MRIGLGFDIHRLEAGRKLVLGGVVFDYPKGLAGHSDGDVVFHAVCDALLGAAGLGDIGEQFPDTDPQYAGADSAVLLEQVVRQVSEQGLKVTSVDCVILAEQPKIAPQRIHMRQRLSELIGCELERTSIKGKTFEGLGEIGQGNAIAAQAVALLTDR